MIRKKTGGRKQGTPNKVTKALKETILGALDKAGGEIYLAKQAGENPAAFMTLLGKLLPSEMKTEHIVPPVGPDGKPLAAPSLADFYKTVAVLDVKDKEDKG